jgi:hypothetical protein
MNTEMALERAIAAPVLEPAFIKEAYFTPQLPRKLLY